MSDQYSSESVLPGAVYRLLMGIALLGSELRSDAHVRSITEGLSALRPDLPQAAFVRGLCLFQTGAREDGLRALEEASLAFPDYQMGRALLAVCMAEASRGGWQEILEAVIDDGRDENAVAMSCAILGRDDESRQVLPVGMPANALWA